MTKPPMLRVNDLKVHFPVRKTSGFLPDRVPLKAVDGISFSLGAGETLGIVGESGCGKSTLGRAILSLVRPTAGRISWLGVDIAQADKRATRLRRKDLQLVFQDPLASLNPRMTIGEIIAEPLRSFPAEYSKSVRIRKVNEMLHQVGLSPGMTNRYPHEFSGGQSQRISIARAMILTPKLVVLDEPVSALDVSIQAQIINLLKDLQAAFDLSYIFISHDLSVVQHMCDRVLIMYLGQVVEQARAHDLFVNPRHPYTRSLIDAVPIPDPVAERARQTVSLTGDPPSPLNPPAGCRFHPRCPHAVDACQAAAPELETVAPGHDTACFRWRETL